MSVTSIEETSGSPLSGYTGDSVDYSRLTFVATYVDESTGSVTPASCTPSVWGEAGTETITFHFDGTDVTCEVEGTAIAPVVTSLTISGTLTGVQEPIGGIDNTGLTFTYGLSNGESVVKVASDSENGHDGYFDFNTQVMDYDFYAVPSGSGLDIEEPTRPDATWKEDATGTQTVTYTVSDLTGYWSGLGYIVPDPAPTAQYTYTFPAVLDHIELVGDLTHTNQDRGSTPDASGVTVKAVYSDESEVTLTSEDYTVSAAPVDGQGKWAYGNPNNLTRGTITFSYTEGDVTQTATKRPMLHYPVEQSLSANEAGHVYFDMDPEWYTGTISGTSHARLKDVTDYFQGNCQVGDIVALPFLADDYDNDTPQTMASLGPYITAMGGYTSDESGTINTPGFVPKWACEAKWEDGEFVLNKCYSAVSINGNAQTAQGFDVMYVIGKLTAVDTTNGYKKSDLTLSDDDFKGAEYLVHITV